MRRLWADGAFANRPKPRRPDAWTAAEDLFLTRHAGEHPPGVLATMLSEHTGLPRTETAVVVRMKRLHLSVQLRWHSARSLAALFGVDGKTITHSWIARGWLRARQQRALPGAAWYVTDADLDAFIRGHLWRFDWRKMWPGRWRSLAETLHRADPYLTIDQAATALGVKKGTLTQHCAKGWLPHVRRLEKSGAQSGRILVRRSDLRLFAYRRPCLVGVSGRKAKAS